MVDIELFEMTANGLVSVTDMMLYAAHAPGDDYFKYPVRRPVSTGISCSYSRYFTFKITGEYSAIKGIRINLPKAYEQGDWSVAYKLTNEFVAPAGTTDEFGRIAGAFDGSLTLVDTAMTVFPRLSTSSPQSATGRERSYTNSATVWTEFLVLQFRCHPGTAVDNFGLESVKLLLEEME